MRYTELSVEDVTQNPQWDGFIGKNKKNQIISFRKIYFDLTQDIETAILLEEICYWYGKPIRQTEHTTRLRIKQDGFLWLAKRKNEWFDLIRLTLRKYDRAIKKLKKLNFIETKITRFQNKNQTLVRLTNHFIEEYNKETNKIITYLPKDVIDMDAKAKDIMKDSNNPNLRNGRFEPTQIYETVDLNPPNLRNGRSLYTTPLITTPLSKKEDINFSEYKINKEELREAINFYNKFWDDFETTFTKSSWSPILKFYNAIPASDIKLNYFLYLLKIKFDESAYFQVFDLWNKLGCSDRNVDNSYNKFIALIFTMQKRCTPITVETVNDVKSVIYALHNFMDTHTFSWPEVS